MLGQLGRISNNVEIQSWSLGAEGGLHAFLGNFEALQVDVNKLQHLHPDSPTWALMVQQARLALSLQQLEQAYAFTKELEQELAHSPFLYFNLPEETICAEVPLTLWQCAGRSTDSADIQRWRASAKRACRRLAQFAHIYPIGKPDWLRYQGDYDWLNGNYVQARRNWQASLEAAQKLSMPRYIAQAHWSLGHLPGPQQSVHRQAAREILEGLGALAYFEYLERMV